MQPSTLFEKDIRAYQIYALYYGRCPLCRRTLCEGESEYAGALFDGSMTVACDDCKNVIVGDLKKYVYHPKDFSVPDMDTKLWRYLDFPKFMSLLDSRELFFTRADRFEDTFEGARGFNFQKDDIYKSWEPIITYEVKSRMQKKGYSSPTVAELEIEVKKEMEILIEVQQKIREEYYVSCWHANDRESEAMWKLYISAKNQGVAIQTTAERLCYSIGDKNFEIGYVNYVSYDKPLEIENVPIWYKRTAFKHENEVRVVFHEKGAGVYGKSVKMDLDMLIEKIYIAPSAPLWFVRLVENVLLKYGLDKPVEHSRLDEIPIF